MHKTTKLLQKSNFKVAIALTGGGSLFASDLLASGGTSSFLLDLQIPYSKEALYTYLGNPNSVESIIKSFNSADTADRLAHRAFVKAEFINYSTKSDKDVSLGIAVTASLATENQREGRENSAFITVYTNGLSASKRISLFSAERWDQEHELAREIHRVVQEFLSCKVW